MEPGDRRAGGGPALSGLGAGIVGVDEDSVSYIVGMTLVLPRSGVLHFEGLGVIFMPLGIYFYGEGDSDAS